MHTSYVKTMRFGSIQPFLRLTSDDARQQDTDLGVVTYDDDENYKVSLLRAGWRSDHILDPLCAKLRGHDPNPLNASAPLESDAELMVDKDAAGLRTVEDGVDVTDKDKKSDK